MVLLYSVHVLDILFLMHMCMQALLQLQLQLYVLTDFTLVDNLPFSSSPLNSLKMSCFYIQ